MPIGWREAEPLVYERELAAMDESAPDMGWVELAGSGGWEGFAPGWAAPRTRPGGLDELLGGERLQLRVEYLESHPMYAPVLTPLHPDPPRERRLNHDWHLNGDGTLCLVASAALWDGRDTAADLVIKASGWFIEYRLKELGLIETMSETGIYDDASRDAIIASLA